MPEMPSVRLRLPLGLFEFVQEAAADEGQPVSTYLQQILCQSLRHLIALHANAKAAGVLDQMLSMEREMVQSGKVPGSVGVSVAPPQEDKNGRVKEERFESDLTPSELESLLSSPPASPPRKKKQPVVPVPPQDRAAAAKDLIVRMSEPRRSAKGGRQS
jgi:hypothetical protein